MSAKQDDRESLFDRIKPWLLPLAPFVLSPIIMLMPDAVCERVTAGRWELEGARILPDEGQGILVAHLFSRPRGRGGSFTKLVTVDLGTGAELGRYVTSDWVEPLELEDEQLWVRQGGIRSKRWTAYALPGLTEVQERQDPPGDDPQARRSGSLQPARCERLPEVPRAIDGELLLDGACLCDNATGRLLDPGGGDRLVAFQDLQREKGKLILGRLATGDRWVWRFHERERFGQRPREAHGYRVAFASLLNDALVLVLEQDDGEGDVWVVAVAAADGRQRWARRYD